MKIYSLTLLRLALLCLCAAISTSILVVNDAKAGKKREYKVVEGFDPAVSPDGKMLAYALLNGRNIDLWISTITGDEKRRLTHHEAKDASPAWSPDGRSIVFVSHRSGNGDLYVVAADGSTKARRLTDRKGLDDDPDWSPDGRWIAFSTFADREQVIALISPEGGTPRLLDPNPYGEESDPSWSPDGSQLAVITEWEGDSDVFLIRIDDERPQVPSLEAQTIRMPDSDELEPAWHPRGHWIAVSTDRIPRNESLFPERSRPARRRPSSRNASEGAQRIVAMLSPAIRSNTRRVTNPTYLSYSPTWTPDGRSLLYVRGEAGRGERTPKALSAPEIWIKERVAR